MVDATQSASRPLELTELLTLMGEVNERINSTLDLDELMARIAEIVKRAIDYEVFAILLLNEKTQELHIRFSIGHPDELVRNLRIKVGEGIVGRAAQTRRSILVNDVLKDPGYIQSLSPIRSELAVPLITKNRLIGVIDLGSATGRISSTTRTSTFWNSSPAVWPWRWTMPGSIAAACGRHGLSSCSMRSAGK